MGCGCGKKTTRTSGTQAPTTLRGAPAQAQSRVAAAQTYQSATVKRTQPVVRKSV